MRGIPFFSDKLIDVPRYVAKNTFKTVMDDKSGYDHVLLMKESRAFFRIERGGWYLVYSSLPFSKKRSSD